MQESSGVKPTSADDNVAGSTQTNTSERNRWQGEGETLLMEQTPPSLAFKQTAGDGFKHHDRIRVTFT